MLLAVEQPELHVHPAIQQKIADMLIPYTHHNRFILLETHSEHIMLRLLRRIEETTENELPVPEYALKPDDVSVVYVEPTEEGVEMTQLPIDETGEFTRNWPRGFFEERSEDLL
jgi:predicted ATPase